MKSHAYAKRLHEIAEFLLSRPEFETDSSTATQFMFFYEKEPLVEAVKALGNCNKEYEGEYLKISPKAMPDITISVSRSKVCRLISPAKYDCEPILSPEEEGQLRITEATSTAGDIPL